jgi:hypothetical protein
MKPTKDAIKKWIPVWKDKRQTKLLEIEGNLSWIMFKVDDASLNQTQLEELKCLENKRNEWLKKEEMEWHQKSRALWLQVGDNNTKKFHHYANHCRNSKTIWEIKNEGVMVSSFREKADSRALFFEKYLSSS